MARPWSPWICIPLNVYDNADVIDALNKAFAEHAWFPCRFNIRYEDGEILPWSNKTNVLACQREAEWFSLGIVATIRFKDIKTYMVFRFLFGDREVPFRYDIEKIKLRRKVRRMNRRLPCGLVSL